MTESESQRSALRKDDHVRLATEQAASRHVQSDFDALKFVHHALRAADMSEVSTAVRVLDCDWVSPLYINAMTGGTEKTGEINAKLARVAHATGTPIASGSLSRLLKHPEVASSYRVLRSENPQGVVFANLSANATVDDARIVTDLLEADAIQIHINSVQEVVMAEGDRSFSHWPDRIEQLCSSLDVPVIVKEVGFGMSQETITELINLGVQAIDVSGRGGTNFARIENDRREDDFSVLNEWGQSTVCSLLESGRIAADAGVTLFASGGVRNPLDAAKSLALGAQAVGVAGGFLGRLQREGEDALIDEITLWNSQLRSIQALLGAPRPVDLQETSLIVTGEAREFCELRGIDASAFARRGALQKRSMHG